MERLSCVLAVLLLAPACSDDSGSDDEGSSADAAGTEGAAVATDCPERCATKAADCGAPADVAAAQCQGICGGTLTDAQLQCLEGESCVALEQAFLGSGDVCEIGSGGSASASGGSSSGGSNPDAQIGDPCTCSDPDADYESCSATDGPCGDLTCYVFAGEGICSQPCTADAAGDDCPVGECVDHLLGVELSVGAWCER